MIEIKIIFIIEKLSNEKPTSWQKDDKKYSTEETTPDNQNYCSIIVGSKDINVYLIRQ